MIVDELACALAFLPALLILDNLFQFRRPQPAVSQHSVSVVIPARNEERNIRQACARVLASDGVTLELLVVNDGSADCTPSILAKINDPRLRVIDLPPLPTDWTGKQRACAYGAAEARYDLLVFVDADVRLAPDALQSICGFMAANDVGLASGFPRELHTGFADGLLLPLIHFLLLGYLPMRLMRRKMWPGLGAGCGQLIAVTQQAYRATGGHRAVPRTLHDGLMLPRLFRAAGYKTDIFDASGLAECTMYASAGELLEGLLKNASEGMAKPAALPVWTVMLGIGHVLPITLALLSPSPLAWMALGLSIGSRAVLAIRFRSPVWSALLHPLGVAVLLLVQWTAVVRQVIGYKRTWRGRSYPA
jgi:Glycosyl transferase family 2